MKKVIQLVLGVLILPTLLIHGGCSSSISRKLAGSIGLIGQSGEVIIFYKERNKIVIKQCEDYTVLNRESDFEKFKSSCKKKEKTALRKVEISDFKDSLKNALAIVIDFSDANDKKKEDLKSKIKDVKAFIKAYGTKAASLDYLSQLEQKLDALGEGAGNAQLIPEIDAKIAKLVDEIIPSATLHAYVVSDADNSLFYNILKTYVKISIGNFTLQKIKGQTFRMGSPHDEIDRRTNESSVLVEISRDFEIMTTEVTQKQWFDVTGTMPSRFGTRDICGDEFISIGKHQDVGICPDHPVERVSWNAVQDFIKKLNESEGLVECEGSSWNAKGCYRLPTEAEWELASRGGTQTAYSFGDNVSKLGDYGWYWRNSGKRTHKVASKLPNPYGLYDVHGNVWEWVQDSYDERLPTGTDPLGTSSNPRRVFRGGGWGSYDFFLRSAYRAHNDPDEVDDQVGFRLVRTL